MSKPKAPSLLKFVLHSILHFTWSSIKFFILLLPTFILITLLEAGQIHLPPPSIIHVSQQDSVHEILPNTKWEHLRPCGSAFNEAAEYEKALQCVNDKVWPESPLSTDFEVSPPPRCFIVSTASLDVASNGEFNFIAVQTWFGVAAVLGVYQPETRTLFVVDNIDAGLVYRHELQHFFLHLHDPSTRGMGHNQPIWDACEPPTYTPSDKTHLISILINDEKLGKTKRGQ